MKKTKQTEETSIRVAVFFDGTGNNKTNSSNDPIKHGTLTNIAKLHDVCQIQERLYVEGVGTLDNKEDSAFAKATGNNPLGSSGYSYTDKLKKGQTYFTDIRTRNPDATLELYVFGFSRGASLARDFVKSIVTDSLVKIKYLGILDTVVSLLNTDVNVFFTAEDMERIDQIVHLCAINECRYYFPLTSILHAAERDTTHVSLTNYYSDKVKEIFVPGAHADLGGGYVSDVENVYLNKIRGSEVHLNEMLTSIRESVKDDFSCAEFQPIWEKLLGSNAKVIPYTTEYNLVSERSRVKIDLAFAYLEAIATMVNNYFDTSIFVYESVSTDAGLIDLRDRLIHYVKLNDPASGPCYSYTNFADYTHVSANYGKAGNTVANDWLNSFDPAVLTAEIEQLKVDNPTLDDEVYDVAYIFAAFGLPSLYVNAPANDQWFREVRYENS